MSHLLRVRLLPYYFRVFDWVFDDHKGLIKRINLWFLQVGQFRVSYRSIDHTFLGFDSSSHLRRELIVWVSKCLVKFVSIRGLSLLERVFFTYLLLLLLCIECLRHHIDKTIDLKRLHDVDIFVFHFIPIRTWISTQMALPFWNLDRRVFWFLSWSWFPWLWANRVRLFRLLLLLFLTRLS